MRSEIGASAADRKTEDDFLRGSGRILGSAVPYVSARILGIKNHWTSYENESAEKGVRLQDTFVFTRKTMTRRRTMTHEFDGKKYEKASAHQREWGTKLIAELGLSGSEAVLDLGCGDGTLTAQIADLLPYDEVMGIDASQGMIDAARPKERKNLSFCKMDINDLDFRERFDVVFSNATLHSLGERSPAIAPERAPCAARRGAPSLGFRRGRRLLELLYRDPGSDETSGVLGALHPLRVAVVHASR